MPELTIENAADQVNAAIATLHDSPAEEKEGRGIVIAAGGVKFQINAWVCKVCMSLGTTERQGPSAGPLAILLQGVFCAGLCRNSLR